MIHTLYKAKSASSVYVPSSLSYVVLCIQFIEIAGGNGITTTITGATIALGGGGGGGVLLSPLLSRDMIASRYFYAQFQALVAMRATWELRAAQAEVYVETLKKVSFIYIFLVYC